MSDRVVNDLCGAQIFNNVENSEFGFNQNVHLCILLQIKTMYWLPCLFC